jgi:3-hydroxybutyryl-CoA dehydrogenase
MLEKNATIGVLGAGAMGRGIAQLAAQRGHRVVLADNHTDPLDTARDAHRAAFAREVEKGRMTAEAASAAQRAIRYEVASPAAGQAAFAPCDLVIEAVIEDLEIKQQLFRLIEAVVRPETILASNTSSLSIAAIGAKCKDASRVCGIHFFNPAPVMPLVEIVAAITTAPHVASAARSIVESWGKVAVAAADTPGFIVNRVARPYYGESLRIYEEGIADFATIDWALKEIGGFKMGPFELMDFIGNDVNYAVTCSVFEAMYYDPRYRPAITQRRLVEAGLLGRKAKRGYYDYRDGAVAPQPAKNAALGQQVVDRVLAMLVNEAAEALNLRIASAADLDLAMTKGVNYPKGLLSWGDEIGAATVVARLDALREEYGEERYRVSPLLRRTAKNGGRLA